MHMRLGWVAWLAETLIAMLVDEKTWCDHLVNPVLFCCHHVVWFWLFTSIKLMSCILWGTGPSLCSKLQFRWYDTTSLRPIFSCIPVMPPIKPWDTSMPMFFQHWARFVPRFHGWHEPFAVWMFSFQLAYDDKHFFDIFWLCLLFTFPDHGCCLLVFLSAGLWWQTCLL
jgi:hypothetical protein